MDNRDARRVYGHTVIVPAPTRSLAVLSSAGVLGALGALSASILFGIGCNADPVHTRSVDELGPENPAVVPGPEHRPGQPCSVCHGGAGPAESTFVLSGTIFDTADGGAPLAGATIRYIDWVGAQGSATTNCAGNFFIRNDQPSPRWPIWLRVEQGGIVADMQSAVFRESSCNTCHTPAASPSTVGPVYLSEKPFPHAVAGCP